MSLLPLLLAAACHQHGQITVRFDDLDGHDALYRRSTRTLHVDCKTFSFERAATEVLLAAVEPERQLASIDGGALAADPAYIPAQPGPRPRPLRIVDDTGAGG
ncbi:hypothetical protein CFN78_06985 [Amycolatopsis antarctica]|uniref:Uncharacterized protein n=1 Tax=Amycolatopsis antarctica TaxID=1854586 RepID=A0A263D979_9PSEU|nr:hypothetical protein [Amycolatopsis antarctica]OZM74026.1 hypothetical protein CFN78_06985 [Amycolatopsis antarctica]